MRQSADECANRGGNRPGSASSGYPKGTCRQSTGRRPRPAAGSASRSTPARRAGRTAEPFAPGLHAAKSARRSRQDNRHEPSDMYRRVHGVISKVLASGGPPFPPGPRDETLTAVVATHEAPPGTHPVNVAVLGTAASGGVAIDSQHGRRLAWMARACLDRLTDCTFHFSTACSRKACPATALSPPK